MAIENDFAEDVLPSSGPYVIFSRKGQRSVDTIDQLIEQSHLISSLGLDVWYATASYIEKGNRLAENVDKKKALVLDLDVDPNDPKKHPTQAIAIAELRIFLKKSKMPEPTWYVLSGNGVHVYWVLTRAVGADAWREVAGMLKNAAATLGLLTDVAVTADVTRILRLPGTSNFKDKANPKPVRALRKGISYPITRYKTALQDSVSSTFKVVNNIPGSLNADLGGGIGYAPKFAKYAVTECLVLRDAVESGGEHHDEPMWSNLLHLLAFFEDGEDYIHEVGKDHTGYNSNSTEVKFAAKLQAAAAGNTGPTTCATFSSMSPLCLQCKYNGIHKSPAALGRTPISPSQAPNGWRLETSGVFVDDPDDGPMRVINLNIKGVELYDVVTKEEGVTVSLDWATTGSPRAGHANIPLKHMQEGKKLYETLPSYGIVIEKPDAIAMSRLMNTWASQLANAGQIKSFQRKLGWVDDGTIEGFLAGNNTYWPDGSVAPTIIADEVMQTHYSPKGDKATWVTAANTVIGRGDMAINCAVASAFASPLVKFSGVEGCLMAIVSPETGTGKSTAIKLASSVWGDPSRVVNSLNDTMNSVIEKLGICNSMPSYWDEVRLVDDAKKFLREVVFRVAEGKGKLRLDSNAKLRDVNTWQTMMCIGSNESMLELIDEADASSNAGNVRMMELKVSKIPASSNPLSTQQQIKALRSNHGVVGQEYASYLIRNKTAIHAATNKMEATMAKHVTEINEDRFRVSTAACLLVGAAVSNKLGFTKFPLADMQTYLAGILGYAGNPIAASAASGPVNLSDLLSQYLLDNGDHIYHTELVPVSGGPAGAASGVVNGGFGIVQPTDARAPIRGVYGRDDGNVRLAASPFREWCKRRGVSRSAVDGAIISTTGAHAASQRRLGCGLAIDTGARPLCYDFEMHTLNGVVNPLSV